MRKQSVRTTLTERGARVGVIILVCAFGVACSSTSARQASRTTPSDRGTAAAQSSAPGPVPTAQTHALPKGVLAEIPVDGGPLGMASGYGALWVSTHRDNHLYRIDPKTNKVVARIDTGQQSCGTPAVGYHRVFLQGCDTAKNVVVDVGTNQVVGSLAGLGLSFGLGAGSFWYPSTTGVTMRVDARTLKVQARIDGGGDAVFGGGSVWIADPDTNLIRRIDPNTNKITGSFPVKSGDIQNAIAYGDGAFWFYPGNGNQIWRIAPTAKTAKIVTLPISSDTAGGWISVGNGSLWIGGQPAVTQIDTGTLKTIAKYPRTDALTVAFGSLWETQTDENTVWRIQFATH